MTDKPGKPENLAEMILRKGQAHFEEKLAASFCLQPQEERKRRRQAVIQLSIELDRIRQTTDFSTHLCELAIESVIEGDWSMVEEWAEHFTFEDEHSVIEAREAPAFVTFRELLLQVVRTSKERPA
jgi:hypothetical protein